MDLLDQLETDKKTEQEIANTVAGVSHSLGEEILVPAAKGKGIDAIYDKMNTRSLAGMMTFKYLENTGVLDVRDSSLFRKIMEESKWKKFIDTVDDINTMMKKVGDNNADQLKPGNDTVKDVEKESIGADVGKVSAESSIKHDKVVNVNDITTIPIDFEASQEEEQYTANRIMFIKGLPGKLRKYIVGYEVYGDSKLGNNSPTDYRKWKKWDDIHILKLIQKGAHVKWYGPDDGPFRGQTLGFSNGENIYDKGGKILDAGIEKHKKNFIKYAQYIRDNKFSFHQVYVNEVIPVIEDLKYIKEHFDKYRKGKIDKEDLAECCAVEQVDGKRKAEKKEVEVEIEKESKETKETEFNFKKLFPINSKGLFVNSDELHKDNYTSLYSIGPGLHDARDEGGMKEGYLGVEKIDTIMNNVIGDNNYVYITGTLTKILIPKEIIIEEDKEDTDGIVYSPGEVHVMRGIYIDKEGNFKIGQIATRINVGSGENVSTREATAAQLLKRKLITSTFKIFKSENPKYIDKYNIITQQVGNTQGSMLQLMLMQGKDTNQIAIEAMKAQLPRLRYKRKYGEGNNLLQGQETELIEDRPRKVHSDEINKENVQIPTKPVIEGED